MSKSQSVHEKDTKPPTAPCSFPQPVIEPVSACLVSDLQMMSLLLSVVSNERLTHLDSL